MLLSNEFTVVADINQTWALLTDLEKIAPCMPGAKLTGRDGDDFHGQVKIKVGPIGAAFEGTARFVEKDDATYRAVIQAGGKDAKGAASANATIRARLEDLGGSTRVLVETDLDITGRMAQFGRGAIADVSNRLIGQFTDNLSRELLGGSGSAAAGPGVGATSSLGGSAEEDQSNDLNIFELIGPGLVKEYGKPALIFVLGFILGRLLSRRGGKA